MKIIFFGTPEYVLPILETLHKSFKSPKIESGVVAVVTQPPKPTGRKQQLEYSPVDAWAYKKKIPIFHKASDLIKSGITGDLGVLASYGEIIPKFVIDHLKFGILNIHPSLLPKFRGASPAQATLVSGDEEGGVTIIKIDEKLDHGPIISQFRENILAKDTTGSLRERLFERSAAVLTTLLPAYLAGKITPREQDHKKATFTRIIKKEDAFILPKYLNACLQGRTLQAELEIPFIKGFSVTPTPETIERFIRAMYPWPQTWTFVQLDAKRTQNAKRLKILKAHVEERSNVKSQMSKVLVLDEVQLEGKNPVFWKQFKEAYNTAIFE